MDWEEKKNVWGQTKHGMGFPMEKFKYTHGGNLLYFVGLEIYDNGLDWLSWH